MEAKTRRISTRAKILDVLINYPQGLNAAKIREIILKTHATSEQHIACVLVQLVREGRIMNQGRCGCPSCALQSTIYQLRPPEEKHHA